MGLMDELAIGTRIYISTLDLGISILLMGNKIKMKLIKVE